MAETRKLAAILAADVVGYSKLAGADEEVGRAKRLHRRNIDELPDGAFAAFDGRPSPFAAIHSCTGRQKVTVLASRGRIVSLSMCSPRRRYWQSCQLAMNHAGI